MEAIISFDTRRGADFLQGIVVLGIIRIQASVLVEGVDLLEPALIEHADDGGTGGTGAADDDLHVLRLCLLDLHGVQEGCQHRDGSAVLVIVEDRDAALLDEAPLDVDAAGSADVLEVHCAEGGSELLHDVDDLIRILCVQADRPGIEAGKALHEKGLALHDGKSRRRADVAKAQHRSAVGDDGNGVALSGVAIGILRVLLDLQARLCNARRVGKGKVPCGLAGYLGLHGQLSVMGLMQLQGFLVYVHFVSFFQSAD